MAYINDISIQISLATLALTEKSFDPLILGMNAVGKSEKIYTNAQTILTDMISDGFLITDPEYLMAAALMSQDVQPETVKVLRCPSSGTYVEALAELRGTDDAFYGVMIDSRTVADLQAVGDWAESNYKLFVGCCDDLSVLTDRNGTREAYLLHTTPEDYPECAWVGKCLPKQPGSVDWKWKVLTGQNAAEFGSTDLSTIRTNHGQTIQEQDGVSFTNEGITTSGTFIDTIIGRDWVQNQMEIELLALLLKNDKISLDDTGIAQIESVVRGVLKRAGDAGIVARAVSDEDLLLSDDKKYMFQVTVPKRADLSSNDRASRALTGVKWVYYEAGGIHTLSITGLITA
jgi:hypothetical protein